MIFMIMIINIYEKLYNIRLMYVKKLCVFIAQDTEMRM